jgi:hypothetical protein
MQQFYVALDYGNNRFAVNGIYTPIEEIKKFGFRDPDRIPPQNSSNIALVVVLSVVIVLVVVAVIGCVMVRLKNRRLQ